MEENKEYQENIVKKEETKNNDKEQILDQEKKESTIHEPDKTKAYPIRNFVKELKRITWPTSKKNWLYFFLVFVFIIFLVIIFAAVSWCKSQIWTMIGAN